MTRAVNVVSAATFAFICLSSCGGEKTPAWLTPTSLDAMTTRDAYDAVEEGMNYAKVSELLGPGRYEGRMSGGGHQVVWSREGAEDGGSFVTFDSEGSVVGHYWATRSTRIPFELKDQFDNTRRNGDFADQFTIFLINGQKTREFGPDWRTAVSEEFAGDLDEIVIVGVAQLESIPQMMRGQIHRFFPTEKDRWVLMDWNDLFTDAYGLDMGKCNILVFRPDGTTLFQVAVTDFDARVFGELVEAVRSAQTEVVAGPA